MIWPCSSHLSFYCKSWSSEGCEDVWQVCPHKSFDFFRNICCRDISTNKIWVLQFSLTSHTFTIYMKEPEFISKWTVLLCPSTLSYPPWIKFGTSGMLWSFLTPMPQCPPCLLLPLRNSWARHAITPTPHLPACCITKFWLPKRVKLWKPLLRTPWVRASQCVSQMWFEHACLLTRNSSDSLQ